MSGRRELALSKKRVADAAGKSQAICRARVSNAPQDQGRDAGFKRKGDWQSEVVEIMALLTAFYDADSAAGTATPGKQQIAIESVA